MGVLGPTSSPNFHRLYVKSIHTFQSIDMPDMTTGYGRFSEQISFFGYFHFWNFKYSSNIHKLCANLLYTIVESQHIMEGKI